jgi:two-component system, NarL family, sensor histidine kinase UhpB
MSLRLQIHLIVAGLATVFVLALAAVQLQALRESVREEVVAANRVAAQLLQRVGWIYGNARRSQASPGSADMVAFLQNLGRVRANDISFTAADGAELYRSPPSPYKTGRDAPAWFARLIAPEPAAQVVDFPDGRLEIRANASRAVLDAWDALAGFAGIALALLLALNALVFWLVGRAVRPFSRITHALGELQAGRFDVQLPPLAGREAAAIGAAFNRMTAVLQERLAQERRVAQAESSLQDQRALAHHVQERLDAERRAIARELHDELGQSVTGMRSMAHSIAQRLGPTPEPETLRAAQLIETECARLYDAMHALIPRIAPLLLDSLGLADALQELAERTRAAHPQVAVTVHAELGDAALGHEAALTLYRAAQEGVTNALRHGAATALHLAVARRGETFELSVRDNGAGLHADSGDGSRDHYGLRWLRERAESLRGSLHIDNQASGGVLLRVVVPTS